MSPLIFKSGPRPLLSSDHSTFIIIIIIFIYSPHFIKCEWASGTYYS